MANYPFCTIEPNRCVIPVPDERLSKIVEIYPQKKCIPTSIEIVDVAGLVEGASRGEGLGNTFLGHIRTADALIHVVRCFEDEDVAHVSEMIDPIKDIEIVNTELILADIQILERAQSKEEKVKKAGVREAQKKLKIIESMLGHLNQGHMLKSFAMDDETNDLIKEMGLISSKPVLYLANIEENTKDTDFADSIRKYAQQADTVFMSIFGKVEEEIAELPDEDKGEFLKAMAIQHSGLKKLIETAYRLLNIITFYTVTTDIQAWTINAGTRVSEAGGKIHTDFEKGFIKAEVFHYNDLLNAGSEQHIRETGLLRIEGRDHIVQDGDVVHFLFKVR